MFRGLRFHIASVLVACLALPGVAVSAATSDETASRWGAIERYCFECHNAVDWSGGVAFDVMTGDDVAQEAKVFEAVIRKLRGGFMPPSNAEAHPDGQVIKSLISWLEGTLDTAQADPQPGRVPLRRLNRREYGNSVRDLVGIKLDVAALLPVDENKDGFDNNAAGLQVTPSFLDQYLTAARQVALQAVGNPKAAAVTATYGPIADMVISLPPRGTPERNLLVAGGPVSAERWPVLDIRNGGWLGGLVRAHETLAALVQPDTRVVPANGRMLTGADLARHRDIYQQLFKQMFVYLNKGFGPTDVVAARPLEKHEAELGDPSAFLDGAYRSIFLAYVPD